jgi:hypothetical protein
MSRRVLRLDAGSIRWLILAIMRFSSMAVVTVHQAKTQLSKLIARAEAGEEIVIARGREPAVKSLRLRSVRPNVALGH